MAIDRERTQNEKDALLAFRKMSEWAVRQTLSKLEGEETIYLTELFAELKKAWDGVIYTN